jgi:hypothetical protein
LSCPAPDWLLWQHQVHMATFQAGPRFSPAHTLIYLENQRSARLRRLMQARALGQHVAETFAMASTAPGGGDR